jgi:fatty acid-binding protein DegV
MDDYMAIGIAEGFVEAESEEQEVQAWQHLIDTGMAWNLQGWFGRTAARLIEDGICKPPSEAVL